MFASCDDRGSTPSGGSDLTVTIGLPARFDYPSSAGGFSVAMPSRDGALIYASSVTYTAATEKEAASLVAAGFSVPKEGLAPAAIVSFESTAFGLVATEPITVSGVLSLIGTIETADAFKTVPVITVTVQPEAAGAFPMPTAASDYALTFKSDGSSAIFTPNSDQVKITQGKDAVTTEPQADAVKAQAVITVPQSFALGNLSSGEYSVTMAGWSSDGKDYQAVATGNLTYALGRNLAVSMTASQIEYGSITVQLPEKFTSNAISGDEGISIASVGAISYAISQGGKQVASGTLTLGAPSQNLISASPIKIAASNSQYDVAVSFAYEDIPFAGAAQVSSVAAGEATTNAQIQATDIDAQIADLSVSFAESPVPAEWPTLASAYSISYAALDSDDKPGAAVPVTVTSDMASSMSEGFKIAGVPSGKKYQVGVSFTDINGKWTGTGDLAAVAASVDASSPDNAVTVTLTAPEGFVPPITVTTSSPVVVAALAGVTVEGATKTATLSAENLTSENENIESIDLTVTFAQSSQNVTAAIKGTVAFAEGKSATDIAGQLAFGTGVSIDLGNGVTVTSITLTAADSEGNVGISAVAAAAQAVINVEGTISSANLTGTITGVSGSASITLPKDNLSLKTQPTAATACDVMISMTSSNEGTISGSVTCPLTAGISNLTEMKWTSISSNNTLGSTNVTGVTLTGEYSEGTFTVGNSTGNVTLTTGN